jgi:hypothetical protein
MLVTMDLKNITMQVKKEVKNIGALRIGRCLLGYVELCTHQNNWRHHGPKHLRLAAL